MLFNCLKPRNDVSPFQVLAFENLNLRRYSKVAKAEFRTELKLMRQLHHPHIVQFLVSRVVVQM